MIAQLSVTRSTDVIAHLKSIFARHGIPEILMSDNGSQFSGAFTSFATLYGFSHITSSPRFPQSNGEVEGAVSFPPNPLPSFYPPPSLPSFLPPSPPSF